MKVVFSIILGIWAVCMFGFVLKEVSKPRTVVRVHEPARTESAPEPEPEPEQAHMTVTTDQLVADYEANEVAADNVYRDHRFQVGGVVTSINKNVLDQVYVTFASGSLFPVTANLNHSSDSAAAGLRRGQIVLLFCTGGGYVVNTPILNNCSITH